MNSQHTYPSLSILLADDDKDDRFFFQKALRSLPMVTTFTFAENGQQLMDNLRSSVTLPDLLFLDLNMPLKNGATCLQEIKNSENLRQLPVIIYSTSLHDEVADVLYENGAHYYIQKADFVELQRMLHFILTVMRETAYARPSRAGFVVSVLGQAAS